MAVRSRPKTLEDLLAAASAKIVRYAPRHAHEAAANGVLIVDIRSDSDRRRDGIVPGSLHIPRTVLEWRAEPDGAFRNPYLGGPEAPLILLCDHGCSSTFAAAALTDLGYAHAGDVIGGYAAWRDDGLPTRSAPLRRRRLGEPAGMKGPDR